VTCSKVFAYLGIIGGILNVIGAFLTLFGTGAFYTQLLGRIPNVDKLAYSLGYSGLIWVSIVISVVWMIPDIFLLVGISKKKPGFMMVWLVVKMILLVIFTIYSAAAIIILLSAVGQFSNYGQFGGHVRGVTIGVLIYTITIFALANALGYYLWDIVKSAYKQIKEENENIQPAGNYMMNTYGKSEPAHYNHHV